MYRIGDKIASGGMATVFHGRLEGPDGFARNVAIKRLHAHLASRPKMVRMFVREARLAARVRHPNVVPVLDLVTNDGAPYIVMEYIRGASLDTLIHRAGGPVPLPIACSIAAGVLRGLHAAHDAKDDLGRWLGLVHRDVSPRNVLVGLDGVPRVLDFGVAKSAGVEMTREGELKGTLAYMAPEQLKDGALTAATDIFATSALVWEMLTGKRLFAGANEGSTIGRILYGQIVPPSAHAPNVPPSLDAIVLRGLERDPSARFASAHEMASAIEELPLASSAEIAEWAGSLANATASDARRELDEDARPARPRVIARAALIALLAAATAALIVRRGPVSAEAHVPPAIVHVAHTSPVASAAPPTPPPVVSAAPPPERPKPAVRPRPARVVRAAKPSCDPPYTLDGNDVRRYKLECL